MRTTQYVRIERTIAATATSDIRERWLWGLRLLRDPEAFTAGSSQLKPGRADELVRAAKAAGYPLSEREIQYRLRAARTYPTEAQIAQAAAEFSNWTALVGNGFPMFDAPEGEPPADHRNESERRTDLARALAAAGQIGSGQLALFPLDRYEPNEATLKELSAYAAEMAELTARFAAKDKERVDYVALLIEGVGGDLSTTWQDAHVRVFGEQVPA